MNISTIARVFVFLCLLSPFASLAQVFPVQASVQITPPYSPYLSDYTSPGTQKMLIQMRANDVTINDFPVRLKLTIEGVGITIRTKPSFIPPQPLTLTGGGVPTMVYGEDIAEYFKADNLDFAGLSRRDFEKSGKLPEGVYRFSVEIYAYNRDVPISNKATTVAWVILNDPPLLNLPRKDAKVRIIDPTVIAFTWTPRHTGSPNAAFSTEYTFRIIELWPAGRNPFDAFLSQPPLYETTTTESQLVYGPAEPALIPGRKYAWQVQAKDVDGKDLFKNQGRSEVYVFQFGDELYPPENIRQDAGSGSVLSLSWEAPRTGELPTGYGIRYRRESSDAQGDWYSVRSSQPWVTITDLAPGTRYQVQVRSEAQPQVSEYSQVQSFTTPLQNTIRYVCGKNDGVIRPESATPLLMLTPGDVIKSGNFKVSVVEANGASGRFSGTGLMVVPFLNMATVKVVFANVLISDKYELIAGEIVTTYNPGSEISRQIDELHKIGETPHPKPVMDGSESDAFPVVEIDGVIDSAYFDAERGVVVLVDSEGNKNTYRPPVNPTTKRQEPVKLVDTQGNTYVVQKDPQTQMTTVSKVTSTPGQTSSSIVAQEDEALIRKALSQLMEEYNSSKLSDLKKSYDDALARIRAYRAQVRNSLTNQQVQGSGLVSDGGIVLVEDFSSSSSEFDKLSAAFKDAESEYNVAQTIKAFNNSKNSPEDFALLANSVQVNGKNLIQLLDENRKLGKNEADLVKFVRSIILTFIRQLTNSE